MKKHNKKNLIFVFAIFIFFFLLLGLKSYFFKEDYANFASCLTENNFVMYGSNSCSACHRQINMFGDSFNNIEFIDCNVEYAKCSEVGIKAYPTWSNNGDLLSPGVKSLKSLSEISGCLLS